MSVISSILTRRQSIVWELVDYYDSPAEDANYDLIGRVADLLETSPHRVIEIMEEAEEAIKKEFSMLESFRDNS